MINLIIPILDENKDKYKSLLTKLDGYEDLNVFIGTQEKNIEFFKEYQESDNIMITAYADDSSREGMINSLQKFIGGGSIIILRRPITLEELEKFMNCRRDLATCRVERGKIKGFLFNIWQSLLKLLLGVRQYEGDTSVVYLSEDIATVVNESGNLSFSSRVNRWRGVQQSTVEVNGQPVKNEVDNKSIVKFSIIAAISIIIGLVVTLAVCLTTEVGVIAGLLIVCLDVICLAVAFLSAVIAIFNKRVGAKIIKDVKISEKKTNII